MGRISPAKKKDKRKRQKVKKKLFTSSNVFQESSAHLDGADSSDILMPGEEDSCTSVNDSDVYGVDMMVLEMQIEDGFKEQDEATSSCAAEYSSEYLLRCRQQLMDKVRAYRKELECERLEKKKIMLETENQIQRIRTFYTNIALAPTRTGRIAKASLSSTHTAKEFLQETISKSDARVPYQQYL